MRHKWDKENVCERCGMWKCVRWYLMRRPVFGNYKTKRVRYIRGGKTVARDPKHVPPCPGVKVDTVTRLE